MIIGIDEAGIGPILGPLVVAGVAIDSADESELINLGVKDSKRFGGTQKSRELRTKIYQNAQPFIQKSFVVEIRAKDLDQANMYDLEFTAIADILTYLNWEKADKLYIAQLGQTKFQTMLRHLIAKEPRMIELSFSDKVIYEIDADDKFTVVSLASILAKTQRDEAMVKLCHSINEDYISGYPNAKTAEFLNNYVSKHKSLPPETRRSRQWAPLQALLK